MEENKKNFEAAKAFIDNGKAFLLATHERTDGDDLGSMLALANVLGEMDKKFTLAAKGGVPASLQFLPKQSLVLPTLPAEIDSFELDGLILFGCSNKQRTGLEQIIQSTLPILNIDHHIDNLKYGQVNLVEPAKSSVAELIFDFINFLGVPLNADIAKCLLTGMFTDTGSFMHSNTQASTLEAASVLMRYGARVEKIHSATFANKNINVLKAWGKALENARIDKNNGIAISAITSEELKELGDLPADAFGGVVELLNTLPGTKFSIFMRQDGDIVKGSMRSEEGRNINVAAIAKLFGGGGHKLAAGFSFPGKIIKLSNGGWKIEKLSS